MCSNYRPVTRSDRMLRFFGVIRAQDEQPADLWPLGLAPFIRLAEDGSGRRIADDGIFGLLPTHEIELAQGRKGYNARSETVHRMPRFREAWQLGQRCIIPVEVLYEHCYESGEAVRWAIRQPRDIPMGIAGIYTRWSDRTGKAMFTFSMLTVNADGQPVYSRMHAPGEEKRMPVVLDPKDYGGWLGCPVGEAPSFFKQWRGELEAEEAVVVKREKPVKAKEKAEPAAVAAEEPKPQMGLFGELPAGGRQAKKGAAKPRAKPEGPDAGAQPGLFDN